MSRPDAGWKLFMEGLAARIPQPVPSGTPFRELMAPTNNSELAWTPLPQGSTQADALALWLSKGDPRGEAWTPRGDAEVWRRALATALAGSLTLNLFPTACAEALRALDEPVHPRVRELLMDRLRYRTMPRAIRHFLLSGGDGQAIVDIEATWCHEMLSENDAAFHVQRLPGARSDVVTISDVASGRAIRYRSVRGTEWFDEHDRRTLDPEAEPDWFREEFDEATQDK